MLGVGGVPAGRMINHFHFGCVKKKHCSFEGWRTIRGLLVSHLFQGFNSPYSFFLMGSLVGNSGERS